jgi:uncharacterized protein
LTGRKWEYELFPISWEIVGFECKWNTKKTKFPQNFIETYQAEGIEIDRSNFREFVKI